MLRIEQLQVQYGDFAAVSSVSMKIEKKSITALMGANGAGKTSLLSAVAGLIKPVGGQVFFEGEDVTGLTAPEMVERGLCLVPQGGVCFARMTVEENLLVGSYPKAARQFSKQSLERVYLLFPMLREKRREQAGVLSGGQRQMVAIGRALMAKPKCLMFDEISLGLAPVVIRDLYACIQKIYDEDGITVILVEQDTERAMRAADTCFVMLKGMVTLSGKTGEMIKERVRTAYFGI